MQRSWILVVIVTMNLFFLLACSHKGETASGNRIDLEIQQVGGDVGWTATWRLTAPARGIVFNRQKDPFRHRAWKSMSLGIEVVSDDEREYLISDKPRTEFRIHFPAYPFEVYGDYPFITPFSDGGAILYLGHFYARPIQCAKDTCPRDSITEAAVDGSSIRLRTSATGSIVMNDQVFTSDLLVDNEPELFAYVGPLRVKDFKSFRALIDPKLPEWVKRDFSEGLAKILELYADKLQIPLRERPLVFLAQPLSDNKDADGVVGAVNQSQMMLSLQGASWEAPIEKNREEFLRLMAHESFHLWNASLYSSPDRADSIWLHEGAAEAMSYQALLDLGLIGRKRFTNLQTESLNRCIVGRDMRLENDREPLFRKVRTQYFCGSSMVHLLQGLQASRGEDSNSIYRFWAEIFGKAKDTGGIYTTDTFFSSIGEGPNEVRSTLAVLASGAEAKSELIFRSAWNSLGVPYDSTNLKPPFWYRKLISQKAIEVLLDRDCGGPGYYLVSDKDLELIGSRACHTVKTQRYVRGIEGFSLFSQGIQAYDYLRDTCQNLDTMVSVNYDKGYLSLRCASFPLRPPFLRLDEEQLNQLMFRNMRTAM